MTKSEFFKGAAEQAFRFGTVELKAKPVYNKAGTCGFVWNGGLYVKVGGEWVKCLASIRLTALGSRKWTDGA